MESDLDPERVRPPRSRAALASLALSLGVSLGLLVAPSSTTQTACLPAATGSIEGASPLPVATCHPGVSHRSLLHEQGWGILVPLSMPVVISGIAFGLARARLRRIAFIAAAWLLFGFVVVGGLSIGPFYLPSAIAMFMAGKPGRRIPVTA